MDSTTVSIIARAATDLGMTGAQAFGWYLAVKLGTHLLWFVFAMFVAYRASAILANVGRGQQLVAAARCSIWSAGDDRARFNQALALLDGQFKGKMDPR